MKKLFLFFLLLTMGSCISPSQEKIPEEPLDTDIQNRVQEVLLHWELLLDPTNDPWPFVGSIRTEDDRLIGTGVLIGPCHVLTAAHVADHHGTMMFEEYDGDSIEVAAVDYHPDFIADGNYRNDIAILHLTKESDENPMTWLVGDNETDYIRQWKPVLVLGYSYDIRKVSEPYVFRYFGRMIERPSVMVMLPIETSIWNGDSGGPVFTKDGCLVGIVTAYRTLDEKPIENVCSSVEYYNEWIRSVVPK